jgi:hypothetical protein
MQTGPLKSKGARVDEPNAIARLESFDWQSPPTKERLQKLTRVSSSSPPRQDRQTLNSIQMLFELD